MRISLAEAHRLLDQGHIVAIPTETVYGLGGLLKYPQAIEKIYALKGRPSNNPLIIHMAAVRDLLNYMPAWPKGVEALAEAFWPGPMTLVLPILADTIPEKARAGLPTAAFRIPAHPKALELLAAAGPIVMPSANLSGRPSATSPDHVEADFGQDFPVLEGGACRQGLESTILMFRNDCWEIIRLGAIDPEAFSPVLGYVPRVSVPQPGESPLCPGQLHRHYAPKAKLILRESLPADLEGVVLGFRTVAYPTGCELWEMGSLDSPQSVAENLYALLRQLDEAGVASAYVDMRFPRTGLWQTIAERLIKASL
jgi:L-threonylcarbamoyladenylate synthase